MPSEIDNATYRKVYDAELRIISPVVIHTGDKYGFLELFPSQKNEKPYTGKIMEVSKTLSNLDDGTLKTFIDYVDSFNFNKARELFLKRESIIKGSKVFFTESAFDKIRGNPSIEVSKAIINPMTQKPYIPGSSIKGALRTAFLEKERKRLGLYEGKQLKNDQNKSLEYKILDNTKGILGDPFKNVLVSDFFIQNSNLVIGDITVGAQIPTYSGMTDAWCFRKKGITVDTKDKKQEDVIAKGTIVIKYSEGKPKTSMEKIMKSLSFYDDKFLGKSAWKEDEGAQEIWKKCSKENRKEDECFLRIGRYCGIENVTLDVLKDKGGYISDENILGGKSRPKVMKDKYPLGFCLLSVRERTNEVNS